MSDSAPVGIDGIPDMPQLDPSGLPEPIIEDVEALDLSESEEKGEETSAFFTSMNMLNSLIGAGILGVPDSMRYCGVIPSSLLIVLIAVLSYIGTVLTVHLQASVKAPGLDNLTYILMGKFWSTILSICTLVYCYSCMVSYLLIGGEQLESWFSLAGITINQSTQRPWMILAFALLIPGALTIPRSIKFLSYFSFTALIMISFFVLSMIIEAIKLFPSQGIHETVVYWDLGIGIFSAVSIYGLAFALPIVVLPIVATFDKDVKRRDTVVFYTVLACFVLVIVPGVIGYLIFGSDVATIVLSSFPDNDGLMIAVRIGFFIVVSFSYPVIAQSCMASWSEVIFHDNNHTALPGWKRFVIILCTNIIPIPIAMFLPDARPALSIGGAMGGCLVDFFYPAIMTILDSQDSWLSTKNILCGIFAIFGLVVAAISTWQAISDAIDSFSS